MDLLRNAVRPYAWGSRTVLAELLGRDVPAPHPEAELWMGAHPGDPSVLVTSGTSLLTAVTEDPAFQLGEACARRWDNRLPFLLKVLAAEEPLSIQAHPSAAQAAEGYAREEAAGIARDAANRNYPDPTAKPELICALSEFHALAGFRDAHRTVELLTELDVPELAAHTALLSADPGPDGLRALFTTWITLPQPALAGLLPPLLDACVRHVRGHGRWSLECRTILELGERHPGDAGVLAALLMNRLVLAPGEAIHLPAGNLHAYLHGTGVEILANSDNILRGGLTPKHVDVPELLRVLDFSCGDMPVLRGEQTARYLTCYPTPAPEFELSRVDIPAGAGPGEDVLLPSDGPQILICTKGTAILTAEDGARLELPRGASAWLAAGDAKTRVASGGTQDLQLFRATAGAD
ncbi:mannose-6-phosphate isomerase [Crossiella equi]|uniref:mannose-6-phosphate isomerase n=1 Tax=Crossiella equi TaxID=130796 RepID=A0ABS5AE58_9PSEU|nr:mannose-6-phosphate isomerase, class I [Crossiella equi]MBP2474582.1 mannose-6-phosphate isomerase [Crossiella equi]